MGIPATTFGVRDYRVPNGVTAHETKSPSIHDLLAKIPDATTDLTTDTIFGALQSMNTSLGRKSRSLPLAFLSHQEFNDFCQRIEHSANQFSADEVVDVLGMMDAIGVSANTKVGQRLLRVIQVNIADLNADRNILLANLLQQSRSAKTILSDAVESVLPIVLLKKLPKNCKDHDLTTDLQILNFIYTNQTMHNEHRQQLYEYAMNALLAKKSKMPANRAMNILQALLQIPLDFLDVVKHPELFDNVVVSVTDALIQDLPAFTSDRWQICLRKYAVVCTRRRQPYNERFLNELAKYIIEIKPEIDSLTHFLYFFHKAVSPIQNICHNHNHSRYIQTHFHRVSRRQICSGFSSKESKSTPVFSRLPSITISRK